MSNATEIIPAMRYKGFISLLHQERTYNQQSPTCKEENKGNHKIDDISHKRPARYKFGSKYIAIKVNLVAKNSQKGSRKY